MREKVFGGKAIPREFILVVLTGAYLFFCCPFIFTALSGSAKNIVINDRVTQEGLEPQPEDWLTVKSDYFTIYYKPTVNLETVRRRLNRRGFYIRGFSKPHSSSSVEEKVAYRIDMLFSRVKEILDIYPQVNVKIKIFKNRRELNDEYYKIFSTKKSERSFYVHKYRTIYTSEADISDSVIAHEMGHAIADHYFIVVPSATVGEMIAQYVDMHLDD